MKNSFAYKISNGYMKGHFNIYQARNGKIYIQLGNYATALTIEQIDDLKIDVYNLLDFDYEDFRKAYETR